MKTAILIVCLFILLPAAANAVQAGDRAPAFQLADANGALVSFAGLKGKVVLLAFWASWCASCREELPELERLQAKYRDQDFVVIGINVDASAARIATFLRKTPVTFRILIDSKGDVSEAYRFSGLPATFIIDREGAVRHRYNGYDNSFSRIYDQEIGELLKQ